MAALALFAAALMCSTAFGYWVDRVDTNVSVEFAREVKLIVLLPEEDLGPLAPADAAPLPDQGGPIRPDALPDAAPRFSDGLPPALPPPPIW